MKKDIEYNDSDAIAELEAKVVEYHTMLLKAQGALEVLLQIKRIKENENKKSNGKSRDTK